jgi:hypothetical protein
MGACDGQYAYVELEGMRFAPQPPLDDIHDF